MGAGDSKRDMAEDDGNRRKLTCPGPVSGTRHRVSKVSAAQLVQISCAVFSLMILAAALLGLAVVMNLRAGANHERDGERAHRQIPANDISDRLSQTPSVNTLVSSTGSFVPKFSIEPNQGFFVSALETSHDSAQLLRVQGPGRCWNPHPGPFRSWNGMQNGCLIQVWRQWQDGCTHFQWFNTCYNVWDPQIYWTYCIH